MPRLTVFWALHAVAMVVFAAGVWANVSIWLQGRLEDREKPSFGFALAAAWRLMRRAGLRRTLCAFLGDGLLHRRLRATDPGRWLAHLCLLGGFGALGLLSVATGFVQEVLIRLLGLHHPVLLALVDKDTPLMALANETLGLVMLAGMALIAIRRYVRRPDQLRTAPPDTALVALLAVTLLSGYPVEALRLLVEQVPPQPGWYSYLAFPLAQALRPLAWPWEALHYWTFLFHSTVASAFFAYVPFSKFLHVVASPLVATAGSLAREGQGA
jgi:heterodisulfide reductase subunit E